MVTKKQLIEMLSLFSDDKEIRFSDGTDIKNIQNDLDGNIILSNHKPIGICNRTNGAIYKTNSIGYDGYSIELDEDVLSIEFTPIQQE